MTEVRLRVQKHYQTHRSTVLLNKCLMGCRRFGRVPHRSTLIRHKVPLTEVVQAFEAWLVERVADDTVLARLAKMQARLGVFLD